MTNKKEYTYKTWLPILLAICAAIGMIVGNRFSTENIGNTDFINGLSSKSKSEQTLQEIIKYIDNRYVDSVDTELLVEIAAKAILNELDPHSVYISPNDITGVNEGMSGYYTGMGVETIILDDTLRVINVLQNSPAEQAGLQYGDLIISSNDTLLAGQGRSATEQWEFLKSTNKTSFNLSIINANGAVNTIKVESDDIKAPNVDYFKVNDLSYINILRFSDKTYEGIIDALEALQEDKIIEKLVLDLRNNPGGYLPEATKILNQFFVEDKRLLVYTEDRNNRKSEYNTTGRPFYQINKLAVLVDEGSASASEVIAGALQDWDKAIIVGSETFGKGLVQEQFKLSNGGGLRLTTARYYTPSGRSIQRPYNETSQDSSLVFYTKEFNRKINSNGGIEPDFSIKWTEKDQNIIYSILENISTRSYKIIKEICPNGNYNSATDRKIDLAVNNYLNANFNFENSSFILAKNVLSSNIYQQLGNNVKANELISDYDIFIKTAYEKLSKEKIFAELTELQ